MWPVNVLQNGSDDIMTQAFLMQKNPIDFSPSHMRP